MPFRQLGHHFHAETAFRQRSDVQNGARAARDASIDECPLYFPTRFLKIPECRCGEIGRRRGSVAQQSANEDVDRRRPRTSGSRARGPSRASNTSSIERRCLEGRPCCYARASRARWRWCDALFVDAGRRGGDEDRGRETGSLPWRRTDLSGRARPEAPECSSGRDVWLLRGPELLRQRRRGRHGRHTGCTGSAALASAQLPMDRRSR